MTTSGTAGEGNSTSTPSPPARIAGISILVASVVCIAVITLTPAGEGARLPFWCFRCGTRPGVDVLLNILMFVPLGIGLGLLRVRASRAVAAIICATIAIEVLQYAVVAGRFASARDIIANTVGGLIAWRLARAWRSVIAPPSHASAFGFAAALIWVATQLFTGWALGVVTPPAPWWAQIRLVDLGFPTVFGGTVIRSSIGTIPIRYSDELDDPEPVRRQLIEGAPLAVTVTGAQPTTGAAPILLLAADDRLSEIVAIGQAGTDAFFRIRTRAAVVGLRNPALRLSSAFPASSLADTITVRGRFIGGRYHITTEHAGNTRTRVLEASPSWIWVLLVPIPHYAFGSEVRILTGAWLFIALGIAGVWTGQGAGRIVRSPLTAAGAVAPVVVAIVVGLAVIPLAFALPIAHWSEWISAASGLAAGIAVGRRMTTDAGAVGNRRG